MRGSEIREAFLQYFERNGHTRVSSSPLVPAGDQTLLFTNAGMVQFKSVFTGEERRDYVRATTSQKCVRAGGKHNDLENVGRTARHHTFFEMLGNFSFGDYFKEQAIGYCWELLTKDFGLDKGRMIATVFTDDDDAFGLWKKIAGLPDVRVLRLGEKDNFWAMGDTGPCGPCSEVHFHQGDHVPCAEEAAGRACLGPACECDRWLEIWNLVFMQFNRDQTGTMTTLPRPSIDTGMGLERIAAVLQGKLSNWDTDLFVPLIGRMADLASKRYGASEIDDVSLRVIADHGRTAAFLIGDGVVPSNEWRGYVLRRIMRRAMRHGRMLGLTEPFLWKTVGWVNDVMRDAYPELVAQRARIEETVREEEERFAATLETGVAKIEEYLSAHTGRKIVDGAFLFKLYDTYGFPRDLSEEVFQDKGWQVSDATNAAWDAEMSAQRERARAGASFGLTAGADAVAVYQRLSAELPKIEFVGQQTLTSSGTILAMVKDGRRVTEAAQGDEIEIIVDRTPAYAESGGQIGDTGTMTGARGRGEIVDTYYRGSKLIVHRIKVTTGSFREGDDASVAVTSSRRDGLRRHHTGTHLLHAALRKVLGTHVAQAGSLVAPDHLRFDFSHGASVKDSEIETIESLVNEQAQRNVSLTREEMDIDAALKSGAMALFGEKYGQRVNVVKIGDFSTELCGGTHLDATGQLGLLKVSAEGAVAAGVRRIEAVAGAAALDAVARNESALKEAAELLKSAPLDVPKRLAKLLDEQKALERQLAELSTKVAGSRADDLVSSARQISGVAVLSARVDGLDADGLRAVVDRLRDRLGSGVICVGSAADGKVSLVAAVTKDLTKRFQAGKLVQEVAKVVGGGGGGRPDLAQAGGKDAAKLDEALSLVYDYVSRAAG
jgi:alanyl-tRNA synthetase